jgi:PEP-CTERM motif
MRAALLKTLLFTLLVLSLRSTAHADFILGFAQGGTFSTSFSAAPNSNLTLQLILTQSTGETRLSNPGLAIADFDVVINGANVAPTAFTFGTGFVDDTSNNSGITGLSTRIAEFESSFSGNSGVTANVDSNGDTVLDSVLLGTVTYNIGTMASGNYNLSVLKRDALSAFSIAAPGLPIDVTSVVSNGSAILTITAVPEPSSAVFLILGGLLGCVARRRWRANKSVQGGRVPEHLKSTCRLILYLRGRGTS